MSDYDDMDADELSREVAERRGEKSTEGLGGFPNWRRTDPDRLHGAPTPYAEDLGACESLLEELEGAVHGRDFHIDIEADGLSYVAYLRDDGHSATDFEATGRQLPAAIARLWLKCDDEGLFDDEPDDEDEREYTDEELAQSCEYVVTVAPVGRDSIEKLQAAADRLRELSGAADKLDEIRDALPSTLDGFDLVEAVEALVGEREAYRKSGEARFQSGTSTAIPQGEQECECGRPLPKLVPRWGGFKSTICPCGERHLSTEGGWRFDGTVAPYDPADCPWLDEADGSGAEEVLEELREWLEGHREFYSPYAPPVGEKAYEVACTKVLDKLDDLIGNNK